MNTYSSHLIFNYYQLPMKTLLTSTVITANTYANDDTHHTRTRPLSGALHLNAELSNLMYATADSYDRAATVSDQVDNILTHRLRGCATSRLSGFSLKALNTETAQLEHLENYFAYHIGVHENYNMRHLVSDLIKTTKPAATQSNQTEGLLVYVLAKGDANHVAHLAQCLSYSARLRSDYENHHAQKTWLEDISDYREAIETRKVDIFSSLKAKRQLRNAQVTFEDMSCGAKSTSPKHYYFIHDHQHINGIMVTDDKTNPTGINIDYLATHPKNLGGPRFSTRIKGVGTRLIRHAEAMGVHNQKIKQLTLASQNKEAHGFYHHLGFHHDHRSYWVPEDFSGDEPHMLKKSVLSD